MSSRRATLVSVAEELEEQPSLLDSFRRSTLWSELEEKEGDPVFVGAGDSYAASLCTSFVAGPRVLALDPYSLAESIAWARERPVYIISISGETRSNVELAQSLKGVARYVVAVTCNSKSRLADAADVTIELPFRPRAKSPGLASFTLSLSAALKVCGFDSDCDFHEALRGARAESKRIGVASKGNVTHFAANNEAYAVSIYGAAKIYELLGGRAQASLLEEFSHTSLFSLSTRDTVNVIDRPSGQKGRRLCEALERDGYASSLVSPKGGRLESLYFLVFALQMAAVGAARSAGWNAPYFLDAKEKLRISDEMIY